MDQIEEARRAEEMGLRVRNQYGTWDGVGND